MSEQTIEPVGDPDDADAAAGDVTDAPAAPAGWRPRNGQWVKFSFDPAALVGGHQAADGRFVGVFQRGGVDALGQWHVDRVKPVDGDGLDLRRLEGTQVLVAELDPAGLADLSPVLDRADVPAARLATARPGWVPLP